MVYEILSSYDHEEAYALAMQQYPAGGHMRPVVQTEQLVKLSRRINEPIALTANAGGSKNHRPHLKTTSRSPNGEKAGSAGAAIGT